jgi:hypothetical protein
MVAGTTKRPDFLITPSAGEPFYVEVTIVTGQSQADGAARARDDKTYDALNELESPNFFLEVETTRVSNEQPSARRMRTALSDWLRTLDPDIVTERYERDGLEGLPVLGFREGGWSVQFRAIPKKAQSRGKPGIRPIGMRGPAEAVLVDNRTPLRDAVIEKARRYKTLNHPSVIAVNVLTEYSIDHTAIMEALFGREHYAFDTHDPRKQKMSRAPDGVWTAIGKPRYTRNSAVLVAHGLHPWNLDKTELCLYHNPWTTRPYNGCLTRLPRALIHNDKMRWLKGLALLELFGLTPHWPIGSPSDVRARSS